LRPAPTPAGPPPGTPPCPQDGTGGKGGNGKGADWKGADGKGAYERRRRRNGENAATHENAENANDALFLMRIPDGCRWRDDATTDEDTFSHLLQTWQEAQDDRDEDSSPQTFLLFAERVGLVEFNRDRDRMRFLYFVRSFDDERTTSFLGTRERTTSFLAASAATPEPTGEPPEPPSTVVLGATTREPERSGGRGVRGARSARHTWDGRRTAIVRKASTRPPYNLFLTCPEIRHAFGRDPTIRSGTNSAEAKVGDRVSFSLGGQKPDANKPYAPICQDVVVLPQRATSAPPIEDGGFGQDGTAGGDPLTTTTTCSGARPFFTGSTVPWYRTEAAWQRYRDGQRLRQMEENGILEVNPTFEATVGYGYRSSSSKGGRKPSRSV